MELPSVRFESSVSRAVFVLAVCLVVSGGLSELLDGTAGLSGFGRTVDHELEYLGALAGGVATLGELVLCPSGLSRATSDEARRTLETVYLTEGLRETLLDQARDHEPESVSVSLAVTPAGELSGPDRLHESTPVFTHVYLPGRPNSVSSVFGIDLTTGPRQTQGRFLSHPRGGLEVTKRDDLHEVVFVAVPPWDEDSFAAFDRAGRRLQVELVDAAPAPERPEPVTL